ncbi:uncharacterized protein DNG_04412 [Cephalotrichum gorgonifer]|uniref:Beta-lactamase-related domain-containing protein n=1 Tax=Cephalotrichum gorgonifer TaxID=2041049 RepID=A0AAE8SUW8_9PEZI|nr:uncharacterized protein DNG_04412 [Cephalotrichum gorgonifer]
MNLKSVLGSALPALSTAARCPPTGAVLPSPDLPDNYEPAGLRVNIDNLLEHASPTWNVSTTSFSVELTSINASFFEYHHTAATRSEHGVREVDTNTVYRIASITKVFNVLALLLNAPLALDTSITQYVPELEGREEYVEITLRMLASQVAGIPREVSAFDWYSERGLQLQELGFPAPDPQDVPTCDIVPDGACSRSQLFDDLLADQFSWLPGQRAGYSNPAYTLLGYAIENITGKTFEDILQDDILGPLNLTSTSLSPPDPSEAIIPVGAGEVLIGFDIGTYNATAGMFSTPRDITAFLRSILRNDLLSPIRTRQWLKPTVYAGGLTADIGMPWEIYRLSHLTPDGRPIEVYTKSGGIPGYSSMALLLPEYDMAASILVSFEAGSDPSVDLTDIVLASLIPSLDSLSREQAEKAYAGLYLDAGHGTNGANTTDATLSLVIDDGPGLKITEWTNYGKSILDVLAGDKNTTVEGLDARLYPIGDKNRWRMVVEKLVSENEDSSLPGGMCMAWFRVDQMRYASLSFEEFHFQMDGGVVMGVENRGMRQRLTKRT